MNPATLRHKKLLDLIRIFRPRSIVEIGTFNGHNAICMLQAAHEYCEIPQYIGYDLFEDASAETDAAEFNVKQHHSRESVLAAIKVACPWADVNLIKGNTRQTLTSVTADFAFIDGGHSIETIRHDYEALKHSGVIVFDDYYRVDGAGQLPDITKWGCNYVVKDIPHAVIEADDMVRLVKGGPQSGWNGLAVCFGA